MSTGAALLEVVLRFPGDEYHDLARGCRRVTKMITVQLHIHEADAFEHHLELGHLAAVLCHPR